VDVVGDAHSLAAHFPPKTFDGAYSISVFEHLAMRWKVVLDLNHVLKPEAVVFVSTHPAWPTHERPWDFWRFSTDAMRVLFNPATGFDVSPP
jgi:2-polyprenyl-3-methyl-5-hydroxy-6-metoxy-1,4-benzoquinol methylase